MRRADGREAPRFLCDERLKVVRSQRALLLQVGADLQDCVFGQQFPEQDPVCGAPFGRGRAESAIGRMWRQKQIVTPAVGGAARPRIRFWVLDHAGSNGIEVDVSVATEDIVGAVDQAGLVAALPQGARASMAGVEESGVLSPQPVHHRRDGTRARWRNQQMRVIVHQDVSVQDAFRLEHGFTQQRQIAEPIRIIQKAREAIVAPLDDVLRNRGQVKAR